MADSRFCRWAAGVGTTQITMAMAASASRAMSQKRPDNPTAWVIRGPVTMAMAKVMPKLTPMKAMALVRFCSRVRSDRSAMTAAEMAPLPCRARPTITPQMESLRAAMTLPAANISRPPTMRGLRPMRSESSPKGIWNRAWVMP
ncbi:hypothetical protein D3C85_1161600 [compost metagenome]